MPSPYQITPADLGLPPKFQSWRPGQWANIEASVATNKPVIAACQPTGSGKSVYAIATALLYGGRSVYVTATKSLQSQLSDDFRSMGIRDMRGRQNYHCVKGGRGDKERVMSCTDGRILGCRDAGCPYTSHRNDFLGADLGLTNYDYMFSSIIHSEGIGDVKTLILDEGHAVVERLSAAIEIRLNHHAMEYLYDALGRPPEPGADLATYRTWAHWMLPKAQTYFKGLKESENTKWLAITDSFILTLQRIATVPQDWILDTSNRAETLISPLWPTEFADKYLRAGIQRLMLVSATLVPKTLSLLNITQEESIFFSQDNSFNPARSPAYLVGEYAVDYKMTAGQWTATIGRMDTIIDARLDRKAIIHCTSYEYGKKIYRDSNHRGIMIFPRDAKEFAAKLLEFITSPAPAIFLSPGATTGYDFPYSLCEYQILLKVPFIDTRSPVMKARAEADPEYAPYLVSQTLVQTCGRGMRAPDDQCENFILDRHAQWFLKPPARFPGDRKGGYQHLVPPWFVRQLVFPWRIDGIPKPPPPLNIHPKFNPISVFIN